MEYASSAQQDGTEDQITYATLSMIFAGLGTMPRASAKPAIKATLLREENVYEMLPIHNQ